MKKLILLTTLLFATASKADNEAQYIIGCTAALALGFATTNLSDMKSILTFAGSVGIIATRAHITSSAPEEMLAGVMIIFMAYGFGIGQIRNVWKGIIKNRQRRRHYS